MERCDMKARSERKDLARRWEDIREEYKMRKLL